MGSPASPGVGSDPFVSAHGSVDEDEPRPKRSTAGANLVFNRSAHGSEQTGDVPGFEQVEFEQLGVEQTGVEKIDLRSGAEQRSEQLTSHTNGSAAASSSGARQGEGESAAHAVPDPMVEERPVAGGECPPYRRPPGPSRGLLKGFLLPS